MSPLCHDFRRTSSVSSRKPVVCSGVIAKVIDNQRTYGVGTRRTHAMNCGNVGALGRIRTCATASGDRPRPSVELRSVRLSASELHVCSAAYFPVHGDTPSWLPNRLPTTTYRFSGEAISERSVRAGPSNLNEQFALGNGRGTRTDSHPRVPSKWTTNWPKDWD